MKLKSSFRALCGALCAAFGRLRSVDAAVWKRSATALGVAAAVTLAIIYAPLALVLPVFVVLIVLCWAEYVALLVRKYGAMESVPWLFLLGLPMLAGLAALPLAAKMYDNMMMLYLIAIVKVSDMGGFAIGTLTAHMLPRGNHKMCPSVSPNKSWEGLAGSIVAAMGVSALFFGCRWVGEFMLPDWGWGKALAFGAVAALVGTFGDLLESKLKRFVGVKDSSTVMPAGLGGVLDMFDSLLFAPAVLLCFV